MLKALFRGKGVLEKHVLVRKIKYCTVVYFVDDTILKNNILFAKRGIKKRIVYLHATFCRFFFPFFFLVIFFVWEIIFFNFYKDKGCESGKVKQFSLPLYTGNLHVDLK